MMILENDKRKPKKGGYGVHLLRHTNEIRRLLRRVNEVRHQQNWSIGGTEMKDLLSASPGCLSLENLMCCLASLQIFSARSELNGLAIRRNFVLVKMVGTAKKSSIKKSSKKKPSTQELLAWPAVSPKSSLRRDLLHSTQLFTVPNFLTLKECEAFIRCAEVRGLEHQGSGGPAKGEAFRDNDRLSDQNVELAGMLWQAGLRELFQDVALGNKVAVGLNPNIRLYRYGQGQRFGPHYDESVNMDGGAATEFTLLVYLTGDLSGGETVFYDRRKVVAEVAPSAGMALFHVHGARCLLHEAKSVMKGVKYVLRSDVIFA